MEQTVIRTKLAALLFSALACAAAFAAPVAADSLAENRFAAKSGDWLKADNWTLKAVPRAANWALLRNQGEVVLNGKAPKVGALHIGSAKKPTTLAITQKGVLEADDVRVWRNVEDAQAVLRIDGGQLSSGLVSVGACPTIASRGVLTLSSGKLFGRVRVGSHLPKTGVGTLSLVGSGGEFAALDGHGELSVAGGSALRFECDAKGATCVSMEKSLVALGRGALISVDASAYVGNKKQLPLVLAGKLRDDGAEMRVEASPKGKSAKIVKKANAIYLVFE